MSAKEILEIIEVLPKLSIYLLPGIFFIKIIQYQLGVKRNEDKFIFLYYLIVSYIFIALGETVSEWCYGYSNIYTSQFTIGIILFSLISGYLAGNFLRSDVSLDVLRFLKIYRTNSLSIFSDIKDVELGTWIKVYLNDDKIVYSGALREYENSFDYDNTFLLLSNYISYSYAENKIDERVLVDERENNNWVAIKIKNVNRIEIEYAKESKKLKGIS